MGPTALVLMFLNRDTTHQFIILIYYLKCKIHSKSFKHIRNTFSPFLSTSPLLWWPRKVQTHSRRFHQSSKGSMARPPTVLIWNASKKTFCLQNDHTVWSTDLINSHKPMLFRIDKSVFFQTWLPWVWLCCHKKIFYRIQSQSSSILVWQRLPF